MVLGVLGPVLTLWTLSSFGVGLGAARREKFNLGFPRITGGFRMCNGKNMLLFRCKYVVNTQNT